MQLDKKKIVTARHRKGWNQTQLAKKSKLTITTISKAENEFDVYPGTGEKICRALNVALADVVIPEEERNAKGGTE